MPQTPTQATRETQLVAKYVSHELTGTTDALTVAERAELATLFAIAL